MKNIIFILIVSFSLLILACDVQFISEQNGVYAGKYSGDLTGTLTIEIDEDKIIGILIDDAEGESNLTGNYENKKIELLTVTTISGLQNLKFSGSINIEERTFSGTWELGAKSGSFKGTKQ